MNKTLTTTLALVALSLLGLAPSSAHAYRTYHCKDVFGNVERAVWAEPAEFTRLYKSVDGEKRTAYQAAVWRWNAVAGARNVLNARYKADRAVTRMTAWTGIYSNEVGTRYSSDDLEGNLGKTNYVFIAGYPGPPPNCRLYETDVQIARRDCLFGPCTFVRWADPWPPGTGQDLNGRHTMYHEFGHAVGFRHQDGKYNVMPSERNEAPGEAGYMLGYPDQQYYRQSPLPNDELGMRVLYSNSQEVFNSAQYPTFDDTMIYTGGSIGTTHNKCPGAKFRAYPNVGNPGSLPIGKVLTPGQPAKNYVQAFMFRDSDGLFAVTPTVEVVVPEPGQTRFTSVDLLVPWGTPAGTYSFWLVMWEQSPLKMTHTESIPWDHVAYQAAKILVGQSGGGTCPSAP